MKLTLQGLDLEMRDLTPTTANELSVKLSDWQKNPQFMRFLKDIPVSPKENLEIIKASLAEEGSIYKVIIDCTKQEIIGSILFDHFDNNENSLESYTRVDPSYNGRGIGVQYRKRMIHEVLSGGDIQKIISWHSAWNQASFIINKRAGFRLMDFVPDQTFLPNIGKITDDFKREIDNQQIAKLPGKTVDMSQGDRDHIMQGLQKHNLFHLLTMDT